MSRTAPHRSLCPPSSRRLAICIVFVPMFFLSGVARYLFVPLAEAVVFAMLASLFPVADHRAHHGEVSAEGP